MPVVLALFASTGTQATMVTLSGNSVEYTFDDSQMGLFGTPEIAGNTLYFTPPPAFKATSNNGAGLVTTSETIGIKVSLKPGYSFSGLSLLISGDYLLNGPGTNTADVGGSLTLTDSTHTQTIVLDSTSPLNVSGLPTSNWEEIVTDLTGWVPDINLTLTSTLSASTSEFRGQAFVEQKYAGITVSTVPEPATLTMMLLGLGLLILGRQRGLVRIGRG